VFVETSSSARVGAAVAAMVAAATASHAMREMPLFPAE